VAIRDAFVIETPNTCMDHTSISPTARTARAARYEDGKSRSLYVPPEHAETARQAQRAWADFWKIGCALSKLNRDGLQKEWQQEKRARKPLTTGSTAYD